MEFFMSQRPSSPPPTEKKPIRKTEGRLWFKVTGPVRLKKKKSKCPTSTKYSFIRTIGGGQRPVPETGKARLAICVGGTKEGPQPSHILSSPQPCSQS